MKIAIVGLGYVGAVTAACLARDGHEVLGVDLDSTKLDLLERGKAPIVEDEIDAITAEAAGSGRLTVQAKIDDRVVGAELIFVCVGTPSDANGGQNLEAVTRVAEEIGKALQTTSNRPVVVLRSTVPPGTTNEVVLPAIARESAKELGSGFGLCFVPEFLREGSSVSDFYNPPMTIAGGDAESVNPVRKLFAGFPGEFIETTLGEAEMLKLVCNSFHALKVSFANEIGRLGKQLGVDGRRVMAALCADKSLNISEAYLRPGFAFGGSCLPKDLRALAYIAKHNDVDVPLMDSVLRSNELHIDHAFQAVMESGVRNVGLVGLSFKQGTDDLRESPLVLLAERLIGKGRSLKIYDAAVSLSLLVGANRRYIHEVIPHIGTLLSDDLDDVVSHAEVLLIGHRLPEMSDSARRSGANIVSIVDLVGGYEDLHRSATYTGACW